MADDARNPDPDSAPASAPAAAAVCAGQVGVGPWVGLWPADPRLDPALLADGDRRNVVDRYRYWRHDAIVSDLDLRRRPFHVAIENWQHDFNIGSVVRTANAFLAARVHIVGNRRWNRRGAMVTDRYQHIDHHESVDAFQAWAFGAGLPLIGVDNLPGATPIETTALPVTCVLVFGQEGPGLSADMRAVCGVTLSIAQFGSTRSINAGAAAAIAMHSWVIQHAVPETALRGGTPETALRDGMPNTAREGDIPQGARRDGVSEGAVYDGVPKGAVHDDVPGPPLAASDHTRDTGTRDTTPDPDGV